MMDRRGFLKILGLGAGAVIVGPRLAAAETKKVAIKLDKAEKLRDVGGSVILKIKDRDILLVRDTDTTIRAFDPMCTHQKCIVAYNNAAKRLDCPCHGSSYDLNGKPQSPLPPAPLKVYPATLADDRVILEMDV